MKILSATDLRLRLADAVEQGQQSILIASAFVSEPGYEWLKLKAEHIQSKILIGRFSPNDFQSGASSFSCLRMALNEGWKLGINPQLHSKVTIIDNKKIFLGSSNLTANGLGLKKSKQNESNVFFEAQSKPNEIIQHLLKTTQFLDEEKIKQMENFLANFKGKLENFDMSEWPERILDALPSDTRFFSSDFPDISLNDIGKKPSCFFTELQSKSPEIIFRNSSIYKWVVNKVTDADTEYTNFGWLTQLVHDSLLDVPPMHRADVKVITALLFEFVETFSDDIIVKQHQRTKSMHLKP